MNADKENFLFQHRFSVAPMMDWTDRHCRYFHRLLTKNAVLYTEMVTADAVIHGDRERLLGFSPIENPLILQLGGSDPHTLYDATKIALDNGYNHINLNVGCPSDRVQSGAFGACLMREPKLVAECVRSMKQVMEYSGTISVKCRIGVDEQDPEIALDQMAKTLIGEGVDFLIVHARKAWLKGLSPKENRDIPPLDYELVYRLKQKYNTLPVYINGGISSSAQGVAHLPYVDGVMLGRAAYHEPRNLLLVDRLYYDDNHEISLEQIISKMVEYCENILSEGGKLSHITRHMLGLMHQMHGAKKWRRILTEGAIKEDAKPELLWEAFSGINENNDLKDMII